MHRCGAEDSLTDGDWTSDLQPPSHVVSPGASWGRGSINSAVRISGVLAALHQAERYPRYAITHNAPLNSGHANGPEARRSWHPSAQPRSLFTLEVCLLHSPHSFRYGLEGYCYPKVDSSRNRCHHLFQPNAINYVWRHARNKNFQPASIGPWWRVTKSVF